MHAVTVTGKHPFKPVIKQSFHGLSLFSPRVPRHVSECDQPTPSLRPRQMISREQVFVLVEQNGVAAGVSGSWDDNQIFIELHSVHSVDQLLSVGNGSVCGVDDPFAAEMVVKFLVISDVILVCEEH